MIYLKAKDLIDIVATGRLHKSIDIDQCLGWVRSWGYEPRIHPETFGDDPFYANSDLGRLKALEAAVRCPQSKAVWCLRGGYGTSRVLSGLHQLKITPVPKIVIGLSDCTALLMYAHKHWPWAVIHGPVLGGLAAQNYDDVTATTLQNILKGDLSEINYGPVTPLNASAVESDCLEGLALGGNVCLLQGAIGTPWMPDTRGKIIFLEDIDESSFRTLERIHHLKMVGFFNEVKAVVLFDFTQKEGQETLAFQKACYQRIGADLSPVPVFKGQGVGHEKRSIPVIFESIISVKNKNLIGSLLKNN